MASGIEHNAHAIAVKIAALPAGVQRALAAELDDLAQYVARQMRKNAPKFNNNLLGNIHVEQPGQWSRAVATNSPYARFVNDGVKPGGRGLPRFADAGADILAWLEDTAFAGQSKPRRGTMGVVRRNLELRDRYEGLAWHIRHHGTKGSKFLERTAQEVAPVVVRRLLDAGKRGLNEQPASGSPA